MRRPAALIATAVLLAVPPTAAAKEITKVRACGSDGCVTTRDDAVLNGLMNGGPPTVPPRTDGPVVRLRATVTEPGEGVVAHFTSWWVASERLLVSEDGTWMTLTASAQRGLERVAGSLTPFPASEMGLATPPDTPAAAPPADDGGGSAWLLLLLPVAALALALALDLRRGGGHSPVKQGV